MTSNYQLISALAKGNWLIDLRFAAAHFPMIYETVVNGKPLAFAPGTFGEFDLKSEEEKAACRATASAEGEDTADREIFDYWLRAVDGSSGKLNKRVDAYNDLPENSLAVVRNVGPMMKNDAFCGPAGSETIGDMIESANRSSKISAIIFEVDSPGGHIDGTEELSRIIKSSKKPIVGLVNGLAASAAQWAVSGAKYIISKGETSQSGSIGTMISFMDVQPYYEQLGIKFHTVRATKSTDKNEDFYQMMKGKYDGIIKNSLDPVNEIFINSIKANRPGVKEEVFTGKTYLSADALKLGLIDAIGTMEDAVKKAYELAKDTSLPVGQEGEPIGAVSPTNEEKPILNLNTNKMKFTKAWSAALAALGFGESVAESDLPEVTSEHIERLNTELANREARITELENSVATLNSEVSALTADRDAWKGKAETFGGQPGETPSNPEKKGADAIEGKRDPEAEAIDNLAHNKTADKLL